MTAVPQAWIETQADALQTRRLIPGVWDNDERLVLRWTNRARRRADQSFCIPARCRVWRKIILDRFAKRTRACQTPSRTLMQRMKGINQENFRIKEDSYNRQVLPFKARIRIHIVSLTSQATASPAALQSPALAAPERAACTATHVIAQECVSKRKTTKTE